MKKIKIQTQYNYNYSEKPTKVQGKSMAEPDKAYTIPQLIARHAAGKPLGIRPLTPVFYGENEALMTSPQDLDLAEREQLVDDARAEAARQKSGYEKQEARKKAAADKKAAQQAENQSVNTAGEQPADRSTP